MIHSLVLLLFMSVSLCSSSAGSRFCEAHFPCERHCWHGTNPPDVASSVRQDARCTLTDLTEAGLHNQLHKTLFGIPHENTRSTLRSMTRSFNYSTHTHTVRTQTGFISARDPGCAELMYATVCYPIIFLNRSCCNRVRSLLSTKLRQW